MTGELDDNYQPTVPRRSVLHQVRGVDYCVNEWRVNERGDADAPVLVMLHGWGDCGATFQFVVDALTRPGFVVAPDWRGFGRSAGRAAAYWFPDYLADLDVLLDIYSPERPVALVGHSMGGNVAALYAGVMPERVAAFVNVEGFGLTDRDPADAPDNYRRWIESGRRRESYSTYESYAALAERIIRRNPRVTRDRALFVAREWAARGDDGRLEVRADPAHKLPNAVLYRRAEAAACWTRIAAPVLSVCGAASGCDDAARAWLAAAAVRGTRDWPVTTIPGAGHMVHFEQPERLAAAIESFLVNSYSTV